MNNEPRLDALTDDDLEQIVGGMTCKNAQTDEAVYNSLGNFYDSLGMNATAVDIMGGRLASFRAAVSDRSARRRHGKAGPSGHRGGEILDQFGWSKVRAGSGFARRL